MKKKNLIVIAGPTGIGKTSIGIRLAKYFKSEILSADSRQIYKEMEIGTARPDKTELSQVKHHLVGHVSIHEDYNVAKFENEALPIIENSSDNIIFMVGGTGLFIDAVLYGLDEFPIVSEKTRMYVRSEFEKKGILWLQEQIKSQDTTYYDFVDLNNPQRLMRALEICLTAGKPYSAFRKGIKKERNFNVIKILINESRAALYEKINNRVMFMLEKGWLEEAKKLHPQRYLNALNTVGYKELFEVIDKKLSLALAIEKIRRNTRRYAKRQITWFNNGENYI